MLLAFGASACDLDNGGSKPPPPDNGPTSSPGQASVRAVQGSPDAGPLDVYVYPSGASLPNSPTIGNLRYRAISNYVNVSSGSYNVDVFVQGRRSTPLTPTETIAIDPGTQVTAAVTGEVANGSIGYTNFIEPAVSAGQSALIVHHAAPGLTGALASIDPLGFAVYDANVAGGGNPSNGIAPIASITTQLFSFSYQSAAVGPSGPAPSGQTVGGQFFLAPIPANFPAAIGFAAGAPAADGSPLGAISASAIPTQLATNTTLPNTTLKNLTSERLPAGAHLSIFAVDNIPVSNGLAPQPLTLIGTLDP